jgi:hypothetical protein
MTSWNWRRFCETVGFKKPQFRKKIEAVYINPQTIVPAVVPRKPPMIFKTKVQTIYLLIGPTGCGKTTFSNKLAIGLRWAMGNTFPTNIQHISSDDLRDELLGSKHNKHDPVMIYASEAAFALLALKLKLVTSFPINAEFVIVDTTGLSEQFRKGIVEIARENNYRIEVVLFDYKDYEEYTRYTEGTHNKKLIYDHIKRMRKEVYPTLRSRDYDNVVKIKSKDFDNIIYSVVDGEAYKHQFLNGNREDYEIISDVHGCYDSLIELLNLRGFTVGADLRIAGRDGVHLILIGDWIDKGRQCEQVVRFLHANLNRIYLVKGNHDSFVYKWLNGEVKPDSLLEEVRKQWFDCTEKFKDDETLKRMFFDLVETSRDFWRHRDFIVSHAPCHNRDLGKMDEPSCKRQRNLRVLRREEFENTEAYVKAVEKSMGFLTTEAVSNHPKHIFGHHAVIVPFRIKNKLGIDTGCVNGGRLTCAYFEGPRVRFVHTKPLTDSPCPEELIELFPRREQELAFDREAIEPEEWRRIKWLCENKVNFISGTMSPAEKDATTLESLDRAFDYYRSKGVSQVVLQYKWMGSRANLYLTLKDVNPYMISRNGYRIWDTTPERPGLELGGIYQKMKTRLARFIEENNFEWLVIDGELMPWYALGAGLIEGQYLAVDAGIKSEIALLDATKFETELAGVRGAYQESGFETESCVISKADLIKKYGHSRYETFLNLKNFTMPTVDVMKSLYDVYHRQLELYGRDTPIDYKPFALLKGIRADGSEVVFVSETETNSSQFKLLSDDPLCIVSLDDPESIEKGKEFFAAALENDQEGIVVKPEQVYVPGVAPYLKVRNPKYLTIIYGYDYTLPHKTEKLMRQKNTGRKVSVSVNEFDIGRRLLQIQRTQISAENNEYLKLVLAMISEEKSERTLDPRL